jgi:hypothetical protein
VEWFERVGDLAPGRPAECHDQGASVLECPRERVELRGNDNDRGRPPTDREDLWLEFRAGAQDGEGGAANRREDDPGESKLGNHRHIALTRGNGDGEAGLGEQDPPGVEGVNGDGAERRRDNNRGDEQPGKDEQDDGKPERSRAGAVSRERWDSEWGGGN